MTWGEKNITAGRELGAQPTPVPSLVNEKSPLAYHPNPGHHQGWRQSWGQGEEPPHLEVMLLRPLYFQPLGAVSQYPAFQELAALCLLFSHGLGLILELIFALQVQWGKLNEDTQGPKGLISWNSEMKARGSQSVTLSSSCQCEHSIKGQQPAGGMETSR